MNYFYLALITLAIALPLFANIQGILQVKDLLKVLITCSIPIIGQLYVLLMLALIITDSIDLDTLLDYTLWKSK